MKTWFYVSSTSSWCLYWMPFAFRTSLKSLSWAESTQFLVLLLISLRSNLISSLLRPDLPTGLFPVSVFVKILELLNFHSGYMINPSQSSRLHLSYVRWTVPTMKFLIVKLSPLPIRVMILFSYTISLSSSLNVRDNASQPYSTTGNTYTF